MQSAIVILIFLVIVFLVLAALVRHGKSGRSSGGNAANTDAELESLYSLLGDNSGRMKK